MTVVPLILMMISGCAAMDKLRLGMGRKAVYDGPTLVPGEEAIPDVPDEVNYADYWIRKAGHPDEVMMTVEDIESFNDKNPLKGTSILDILELPHESIGDNVRDYISANARYLADHDLYVTGDIPFEQADRQRIIAQMDTLGIPDIISLKIGVMLRRVMGKEWPTVIPFFTSPGDNEFDRGVASSMDTGAPVALLHTTRDGRWSYVQHSLYTAWVPSDAVAFGDSATVSTLTSRQDIIVATGHRVSIFGTPDCKAAIGSIQMGSRLTLDAVGNDYCAVLVPGRGESGELVVNKGFVRRDSNISIGFLPYTKRNVYRQCFVLYGRRYGWGGMYGERDCSRLVLDVFRCFGFRLPRNSSRQAEASTAVISLDGMSRATKLETLRNSPGGISLARMRGHIMIYLGTVDGVPYAIHDMWAWRKPVNEDQDITHRAARITVTDFMLGEGSKSGPFIDRLTHVTLLGNYVIQ